LIIYILWFYTGEDCPNFAISYEASVINYQPVSPQIEINEEDDAALYFSSGTTGFPKAITHSHSVWFHHV
jgi:acyl-coenzyme A synthetase/AMP-(fatty) acid ligase